MRAGKKPSLKTDKKKPGSGSKPGVRGYSKKTELLEDAITQMNAGKYGRSSAVLKELLALDPQNMEARRLFATMHLRLGSLLPARQAFEALANEALERQDYWLAESLLQEYLVAGPRCVPFIEKLGIVYQEKGDELAAAEEFGKAIDILLDDPDAENPHWPAQLYAKIRDIAPASPPAFRLASFFDARSGELLVRPAAAHAELSKTVPPSTELLETDAPEAPPDPLATPTPVSGAMPWDQVVDEAPSAPLLGDHSDDANLQASPSLPPAEQPFETGSHGTGKAPANLVESALAEREGTVPASLECDLSGIGTSQGANRISPVLGESGSSVPLPEPAQSQIEAGLEPGADLRADDSPDGHATDVAAAGEAVASSDPTSPAPDEPACNGMSESAVTDAPLSLVEEGPRAFQPDPTIESVPAPMPWEQVQEVTVIIPPAEAGCDVEPPSKDVTDPDPPVATLSEVPWSYEVAGRESSQEIEKTADSVSAPMPWEQIQDATVTIPQAEVSSDTETRSDSSVATESPFFALSDAVQVEPQGGGAPAWKTPDATSATSDALSADMPQELFSPSHAGWESVSTGDAITLSPAQPVDVSPSPVVEPLSASTSLEPEQESLIALPDSHREPVSSEASLSAPSSIALQAAHLAVTDQQELSPERSSPASEPFAGEGAAPVSTTVADSPSPPENPPQPERTEKPKGTGSSWESIFSNWKYGPSSSKTKRHHAAPVDRYQPGEPLPAPVYPAVSPAVHEEPVPDTRPAATILPDPVASSIFSPQIEESPVTIPLPESVEPDPATTIVSVSDSAVAKVIPESVPLPDHPEVIATPSPAIAVASEPVQVDPSPEVGFGSRSGESAMELAASAPVVESAIEVEPPFVSPAQEAQSRDVPSHDSPAQPEEFRFASAGEVTSPAPEDAAVSHEGFSLAGVSPELPVQPEELRSVSSSEATSASPEQEAVSHEGFGLAAVSHEPPVQPEEFRFVSSSGTIAPAPEQEAISYEEFSTAAVSLERPVEPETFRSLSSSEALAPAPAEEPEIPEASRPASRAVEPSVQSENVPVVLPDKATSSSPVPLAASEPAPSSGEKAVGVGDLNPPALTRDILPALQALVSQYSGAAKEGAVASPKPDIIQPTQPTPEAADIPPAPIPVAISPATERSGLAAESAPIPLEEPGEPQQPSRQNAKDTADEQPALSPVVSGGEKVGAIEPALPSQDAPAAAGSVVPESVPFQEKEEWVRTGESIRFVDLQEVHPARPASAASGESGEPAVSTVASAVDALFQSSGRETNTRTTERATVAKPRPRIGATLARVRLSLSAFIGSCFSTTHALILSLVGLVVLAGALAAIAIGVVGGAWVMMEEKPSAAFQSLTASPQRSSIDFRNNGYLLLLGFDADAGADPIQAGYDRKPGLSQDEAASACLGGTDGRSGKEPLHATASVAEGWFRSSNPAAQFKTKADGLKGWIDQAQSSIGRYRQWLKMPFEDRGYGQAVAPPCATILFTHRLYVAEGFAPGQPTDNGIHRLQEDMEAWRTALAQAKTLPVKMLAVQAIQDDLAVASGLLAQPDFDSQALPSLTHLLRPLDQVESSMRWPMQSELAAAVRATDAQLKEDHGDDKPWHVAVARWLPLPKQRRLNEYAEYYDASSKAAGEGRYGAMPKRAAYIKNPPATVVDYLTNPIENIVGLKPLPSWDRYNGMVIDADARLRLASLQAWLRRGSQEGDLVTRIAKAGQRFYDPYTGIPMLVNLTRGVIYSVGHDGKDQDADPQQDVVVSIPLNPASSGSAKGSSASMKPK
ncbi:hypothetical protein ACO9S2_06620 [Nitrospira sp. NS4]|uniref:hypothetical protein n=1 Tax=Nitrospira sp. NS4 TaxID=3414498 RepID=UPI003C308AAC